MSRPLRTTLVVLALGAFVAAGCGSDGGDEESATTTAPAETTTTVSADAEFATALDDLCSTGDTAASQASTDFQAALDALSTAAEAQDQAAYAAALDQAESAVEDIISAIEDFDAAVGELEVPTDLTQPVNDYLEAMGTQLALAEQLRQAIVADDGEAFNQAVDQIQQADEATRQARTDAANEIGAPQCVPDAADAGSATDGTASTDTTTAG